MKRTTSLIRIISVILLIPVIYKLIETCTFLFTYDEHCGYGSNVFGSPIPIRYTIFYCFFWLIWVVGLLSVLSLNSIGWFITQINFIASFLLLLLIIIMSIYTPLNYFKIEYISLLLLLFLIFLFFNTKGVLSIFRIDNFNNRYKIVGLGVGSLGILSIFVFNLLSL